MTEPSSAPADWQGENAAWVTVQVPGAPDEVLAFCRDVGRLLRLSPCLETRAWQEEPGPFAPGKRYRLHALNEWTGIERDLRLTVEAVDDGGFRLAYSEGFKRALEVRVAPHGEGAVLTLCEEYAPPAPDREAERLKEGDRGITPRGGGGGNAPPLPPGPSPAEVGSKGGRGGIPARLAARPDGPPTLATARIARRAASRGSGHGRAVTPPALRGDPSDGRVAAAVPPAGAARRPSPSARRATGAATCAPDRGACARATPRR